MTARPHVRRLFAFGDLETTGLDPFVDKILEVGVIVTTPELRELARFSAPIRHKGELRMTRFAWDQHAKSGLLDDCANGIQLRDAVFQCGVTIANAQLADPWCADMRRAGTSFQLEKPLLVGSSVHFDRSFLAAQAPSLLEVLHYRQIDVSGMREDARADGFPLEDTADLELPHRVIPDLELSIALLRRIRSEVYRSKPPTDFGGGHEPH